MTETLLTMEDVTVRYGQHLALDQVSLRVEKGEIVSLLGANGAGKTTALLAIMKVLKLTSGTIRYRGRIDWPGTAARVSARCILVPEGRRILTSMSIEDNLLLGAVGRRDAAAITDTLDDVYTRMPNLAEKRGRSAAVLSGGEQQMLALGRAMMAGPELLLLDEPSLGLSPLMTTRIFQIIADLNAAGTAVLLVEQNARAALDLADRAYVMRLGRAGASQPAAVLRQEGQLDAAYLGGAA